MSDNTLSTDDVRHVAGLARLALTDDEVTAMAAELSEILEYAGHVSEVAADDVEPSVHPYDRPNVFREDEPAPVLEREALLRGAPESRDDRFAVPQIVAD